MSFGEGCVAALGIICLMGLGLYLINKGTGDIDGATLGIVTGTVVVVSNGIIGIVSYIMGKEAGKKEK